MQIDERLVPVPISLAGLDSEKDRRRPSLVPNRRRPATLYRGLVPRLANTRPVLSSRLMNLRTRLGGPGRPDACLLVGLGLSFLLSSSLSLGPSPFRTSLFTSFAPSLPPPFSFSTPSLRPNTPSREPTGGPRVVHTLLPGRDPPPKTRPLPQTPPRTPLRGSQSHARALSLTTGGPSGSDLRRHLPHSLPDGTVPFHFDPPSQRCPPVSSRARALVVHVSGPRSPSVTPFGSVGSKRTRHILCVCARTGRSCPTSPRVPAAVPPSPSTWVCPSEPRTSNSPQRLESFRGLSYTPPTPTPR